MELTSEAQFHLREFSPHRLLFLPRLNALLATDSAGRTKCIDVVTGAELHPPAVQVPSDDSGRGPPPVHFAVHPETSKVVVTAGNRLGARSSYNGTFLLATILQTPVTNPQDEVSVEVPMEQVLSLLKDFQILIYVVIPELLRALRSIQVQLEKNGPMCNLKHHKCATATFTGKAQVLCDAFRELVNKLKSSIPPTSVNHARTFVMALPCLPVLSAWHAQMQLLLPESHGKVMKFESATELPTMDAKMMHIEGVRKLTLVNWPHRDYVWAVPKAMSAAGFYHLANTHSSQASISSSKGDRVSCFACKMYLYSWEPTDEPWSEHERHTGGCPYVRGEYTDNVPASTTESSHPAVFCSEKGDSVVCISSTSTGTGLTAVGTEQGHISIWELDRGLLIMKHCEADIKIVDGVVDTSTPEEDEKPSLEVAETTTTAVASEDSAKKETTTEDSTKKEKEATPQVTITVEVEPVSEEESKDKVEEPPSLSSPPPPEDEVVKSKLPSPDAGDGEKREKDGEEVPDTVGADESSQPARKQSYHITALSILSPRPPKEEQPSSGDTAATTTASTAAAVSGGGSSGAAPAAATKQVSSPQAKQSTTSSSSKQAEPSPLPATLSLTISPALVGAVSVTNGGRCTPTLLVYSIKSNRPLEKGKSEQKVKPPMPPPPDPLDYDPWEPIEIAPPYMGTMPTSSSASSVLDVLSETKTDGNTSPADLKYLHSIPLDEFSCGADSGTIPEIREILPLAGGQLLAVLCNFSSISPLLGNSEGEGDEAQTQKREDPSHYGGILLFRTTLEEDGDRLRLRVDGEPIKVVRFSDCSSTVVSMCVITHGNDVRDEKSKEDSKETKASEEKEREREKGRERDVLLGTVTRKGDVMVYDCSSLDMNVIGHYSCHNDLKSHDIDEKSHDQKSESRDSSKPVECISCTYCPSTYHLAVADSSGQVTLLSVRELLLVREKLGEEEMDMEESQAYLTRPLTSVELDHLLVPTRTSPDGVPYSLSLPNHWVEIHYFQLHRQSPVHLHLGEGKRVTTKVWQHQPPSMEHCRDDKYTFELVPESAITTPIGCVSVSITFANRRCINELATVSLLSPKLEPPPSFSFQGLNWKPYDVLCGPVKLKPLIDVTGQSFQLSLFHPFLVTRRPHVLWLEFKDFFAVEYNDISVTADTSAAASKRSGWRSGGPFQHRLRQQTDPAKAKPIPLQCTIAVTLHPTTNKLEVLSSMPVKPSLLFKLTSDPEFMSHVVLAVCGYRVEEKELPSLPPSLRYLLQEGASVSTVESQFKALELLSWMVGVYLTNTNSGGYTLLSSVISQLLTSLLHACFICGSRSLVHKCARLVVTLYRGREDNRNDFRYSLNNALVQLLPLLPLASSAACIHFFLRLVATLTESCDSHMISRLCMTLLVELTKQLNSRSSFASQLLQTHFKHDGHIFEPELFDIYLSYCQKSTSIVKTQSKYIPGSSSYMDSEYYSILPPDSMVSGLNPLPPDWSHIDPTSSTIAAASASAAQDSSTLQVIADKGGHTIYDMELQLLLDCSKKTKAQAMKAIDEHSTFKHGSFLLFTQRGLLETLPLRYQCISVSGNASVQEANVHTLPNIPEGAPSTTSGAPVVAVSKTMGYSFPTTAANTSTSMGGRKVDKSSSSTATTSATERAQMQRMPGILSDILVSAKELVMQIPSLKSGLAYSVILKFPHPIYLTDISIPAAVYMSSVSVDVWLEEGGEGEAVRVAHSSEIKERSMILGNLMPAPFCQFAKVTFVGRLGANREKAQVFIGSFYGRPVFTGDTSLTPRQLLSLEETILSQYHGARDRLSQALLSYAGLSRKSSSSASQKQLKQCEEKVGSSYQECFKAQVQLARLRHFTKSQHDKEPTVSSSDDSQGKEESTSSVFSVDEEARSLNFHEMTFSRLSKIVGCLVDALLVLNGGTYTGAEAQVSSPVRRKPFQRTISFDPEPPKFEDKIIDEFLEWSPVAPPSLSERECSLVFLSLCIHGVPKLHARACALLTRLCGSQEWWGRFITNMALELFNINQPGVFNKERALLQLSILSQRTYEVSNVIQCLLQVLDEKLTQLIHHSSSSHQKGGGDSTFDHTLLQWIVLLLSHVLASIATQNQPKSHTNLFVPLPLLPSSLILSLTQPTEEIDGESRRAELAERRRDLKRMLTSLGQKIEFASAEEKIKLKEEFDAIFLEYQSLRKQLLAHHRLLRQQKSAAAAAAKKSRFSSSSSSQKEKDKEKEKEQQNQEDLLKPLDPDPALSSLPQSLCQNVARGLIHYIVVLTSGDSWDFLPVACKSLSQMVALTSWSYPLHTLISQEQINSLISFSCQHITSPSSSGKTPGSLEWGQRAVQCLLIDILHHGEIKPYFESLNKPFKSKVDIGGKTASSPNKSVDDEKEDKLPPHDEQELKRMGKMFDKAPLEFPQILLSCGEVEIPLNRRTWKGRKGMEELKKQREKEKKKLQEAKEKGEGSKFEAIPEESHDGAEAKDVETKVATEGGEDKTTKYNETSLVPIEQEAEEGKVAKAKEPESVGGLTVSELKRYLRLTYLQGDFEHMVDFPPPEKHSYGLALHNPLPPSLTPAPYLSYIISNCIDYRVLSSLEVSAELELQLLAKKVYESVLHSLLHARPTPDPVTEALSTGELSPITEEGMSLESDESGPFTTSTNMLTQAVEQLLEKALTPQSNLDLVSVLEFCNDLNSLLPVSSPLLPKQQKEKYVSGKLETPVPTRGVQLTIKNRQGKPDSEYPFTVPPVCSKEILSLLLNCLVNTQTPSSKMWQIGLSVLHTSLRYLWFFVAEMKGAIDVEYDKLLAVFVKLFSSRVDAVELREANLTQLLTDIVIMKLERGHGKGEWYGIGLLLELMVKILDKRDIASLDSCLLLQLLSVISVTNHLLCFWNCDDYLQYEIIDLIKKLSVAVVNLLPDILEQARHPDVVLNGGEQDEEHRRYRYIRSSGQETKVRWIPVVSEVSHSNRIAAELIQLLREVLVLPVPQLFIQTLQKFCRDHVLVEEEGATHGERREEEGEGDSEEAVKPEKNYLKLAPRSFPLLSLVYSDVPLMSMILKLLSSSTSYFDDSPSSPGPQKQGKGELNAAMVQNLFCNFVRFLDNHCKDHSCFFEPILHALRSTSSELRVSKTFMTVVGRLTSEFESECNLEKLINFISEGGGRLVLECLVSGCKQTSPSISRGIMTQSINKLGQKDTLKPTVSGNHHINFFPHATVRLHPSRTSVKELQSSSNTEQPTRTACFNHTYQGDEEWLKMQISLPYPILLHTVQFLQPMGMFQSGPSAVFIECGTQGTLSPPTPVTSLLRTSGLPCIKIEFKQPPVASEVVIHFRNPLVSNSLALSHMQLLGTGFGTTTKSDSGSTSSSSASGEQGGKSGSDAHSSSGWLFIIDQWMGLSGQISDKLMSVSTSTPDFVSATLSLLQHQDTLSTKSSKQLKRLLVAMAMYSQDYGTAIVQHLLGFSPEERVAGSASQSTVPVTTTTLDLLYQLCVPTSDENKQRLQLALRLLSNIPLAEVSLSHHLPTLIRVLSSAVWEGGKSTTEYDEGIFNSIAEHAFSLEVNSPLKSALNSLLCALCYCVSEFFTVLLANCSHLLEVSSEGRAKLLHTLAHVAQSVECSSILLRSDLMSGITNQLFDGFDQLLNAAKQANPESENDSTDDEQSSSTLDVRSMLSSLCTSLAFLTDFVRNWTPGKDWMALEENRRFWPLMVELFSMDMACITKVVKGNSGTSSVVAFELSFCQKVVLEYFSSCLNNHTENKRAFVRLVCNSVQGAYNFSMMMESESDSTSDSKPESSNGKSVLTPFLHNLLLELVLQPESIPIILKQIDENKIEEPPHKPASSSVNPLSFTPTHECLDFHPSFPIGSACYFLEMSPSSPLSKLVSQFDTSTENKPSPPKPKKEPASSTLSTTLSSLKLPLTRKPKPPPAPPSTHSIEISNFELRKWLLPGSSFNPPQEDEASSKKFDNSLSKVMFLLPFDRERTLEEKSTVGGLLEKSREIGGEAVGPALVLHMQQNNLVQFLIALSEDKKKLVVSTSSFSSSLLSLFVSEGGLSSLALCLPSLYRYQWPEKTSGLALQAEVAPTSTTSGGSNDTTAEASKQASLFVSQILLHPPNILPFHSILMLGLCLRVETFDTTLAQNLAMVYVLLRLVLGTELEDLPYALSSHLSFLPYLVLLETLKTTPTNTPEGRSLRKQLLEVGVVHYTLQCLSSAGHHSPRVDSGEAEPMQMEGGSSQRFRPRPKVTTSSDHHYWAKGTGFGTGSTTSNWNMEAITAKQKAEEKYVSLCFAILAEFLSLGTPHGEGMGVKSEGSDAVSVKSEASEDVSAKSEGGEATVVKAEGGEAVIEKAEGGDAASEEGAVFKGPSPVELPDYCSPEMAELLSDSCLLPAMASYLLNDSVLDISKHIELYQAMLDLLSSIVLHPTLCHLLRLPVFSSDNGSSGDETTLASLIAKLREITKIYQKTAKTKQPKAKKSMILHTHVPLSMLLTSFYTYKKPPTKSSGEAKPTAALSDTSLAATGKAKEEEDQVVPGFEEAAGKAEEKKDEDVKKPDKPDEQPDKPVDEPCKPADQQEKPVDEPADQVEKPVDEPDKPADQAEKPVDEPNKPAEQPEKPVEDKGEEKGAAAPAGEAPPLPPPAVPPRVPPRNQKPRTDVTDLAILVKKILSVSEKVASVVSELKKKEGYSRQASVSTPAADSAPASFDFYMKAMKPLQFDTYQILVENEYGTIRFHVPYHFQSRVQSATSSAQNAARSRRLAQEVASLSTSLPLSQSSSVFVRCDEERLDVMKVLITGPSETPYANGCFEFDVFFPPEYPKSPMLVHMRTTGQGRVRFNPNLYNDGKVCLSVLNTWHGRPEEKWNAQNSSFLQVLVSIQSLILVPEPYFNEPGYEQYRGTPFGDQKSLAYNANIYASTVQWAMVDAIKNVSPCFKEVVLQHFYLHKSKILDECEEWKKQLVDGISKMQESGGAVNHIKEYLRLLAKATDALKVELDKIKPEDFRREEEGEGTS